MVENIESRKVRSANIHLDGRCNYRCAHCFDTCLPKKGMPPENWRPLLEYLRSVGITKINIAGGEPFLYPHLKEMCGLVGSMGFTVSIVSNGSLITREKIEELAGTVKWLGLSVDSPDEADELAIGRNTGAGNHLRHIADVSRWAHGCGMKVKLNITVLRQSWDKDFHGFIDEVRPERVKAFRALTLKNANDDRPDTWSISDEQYARFRAAHRDVENMVFEDNSDMIGTYLMFDPLGRWMVNSGGEKRFLPFEQLRRDGLESMVDVERYYGRNGVYGWDAQ